VTPEELVSAPGDPIDDATRALIAQMLDEDEQLRAAYSPDQARGSDGKWTKGGGSAPSSDSHKSARIARAKSTHIPSTRSSQKAAARSEKVVANALQGKSTDDHEPMDVVVNENGRVIGVEVKSILAGKNDKITMHPDSLARKVEWVKAHKATGHTIAIDLRGGQRTFYYRKGFGSFRLSSMQRVSVKELRELVR